MWVLQTIGRNLGHERGNISLLGTGGSAKETDSLSPWKFHERTEIK